MEMKIRVKMKMIRPQTNQMKIKSSKNHSKRDAKKVVVLASQLEDNLLVRARGVHINHVCPVQ